MDGFRAHFTCIGPGKGIALYVKDKTASHSYHYNSEPNIQLGKISLDDMDIITIYRSQEEPLFRAARFLKEFIDFEKTTLVIGDFNICPKRKPNNEVTSFLSRQKFNQLVTLPTHMAGGIVSFSKKNNGKKLLIRL